MEFYIIKSKKDITDLKEFYKKNSIFEILETGYKGTLEDLECIINFEDWNKETFVIIQYI